MKTMLLLLPLVLASCADFEKITGVAPRRAIFYTAERLSSLADNKPETVSK